MLRRVGLPAWSKAMSIELNHTIVHARDPLASATFRAEMLGRPAPVRFGPFWDVELDNHVTLACDSQAEADAAGLPYFIVGHVGDGNFRVGYLIDPDSPQERATAERLSEQLVQRALRLGCTCTGEHGIGLHKMGFLVDEAGAGAVAMMRTLKQALDPGNIMNPGKIFSWSTSGDRPQKTPPGRGSCCARRRWRRV
jgi:FAD/FMN-containing dehydrogenase